MTAAQLHPHGELHGAELHVRLVQARFEALAEWGIPLTDAHAIAHSVAVDIVEVVELLRQGWPSSVVLSILA